ncbi:MAG TPA: class I SAM-dependent methyltransferase [Pseudomonadales bacterium]|nr:class I SAM-dependent methyltransferase [Pseudomonadales bacterium]
MTLQRVGILHDSASPFAERAEALAMRHQLPLIAIEQADSAALLLILDQDGLALHSMDAAGEQPLRIDFGHGRLDYRRRHGGGTQEPLARAVGLRGGFRPQLLDATGGFGTDAFVLASLGCQVTLCERSPVMAALLADALARAGQKAELSAIAARITLRQCDARDELASGRQHDVICLDPMFPPRRKSALPRRTMVQLQQLVGHDEDADALLPLALEQARYRVVVKRPRQAPLLAGLTAHHSLEGSSCRFDVYTLRKLPSKQEAAEAASTS